MNKEIVIRSINSAVDFAVLHDGKLIELHKEKDIRLLLTKEKKEQEQTDIRKNSVRDYTLNISQSSLK